MDLMRQVLGPQIPVRLVHPEELTFQQQVEIFSTTSLLVAVQGAGLTNMIFMPEGAAVIELKQYGDHTKMFMAAASHIGLHYATVHSTSPPEPLTPSPTITKGSVFQLPPELRGGGQNDQDAHCPPAGLVTYPPGPPSQGCLGLVYHNSWPVHAALEELRSVLQHSGVIMGLLQLTCACDEQRRGHDMPLLAW